MWLDLLSAQVAYRSERSASRADLRRLAAARPGLLLRATRGVAGPLERTLRRRRASADVATTDVWTRAA